MISQIESASAQINGPHRSPQNAFLQNNLQRKTLFILMRIYELLGNNKSSDVLFVLFNYESVKESFFEGIFEKKWGGNKTKNDDWPWFRGLNLDQIILLVFWIKVYFIGIPERLIQL